MTLLLRRGQVAFARSAMRRPTHRSRADPTSAKRPELDGLAFPREGDPTATAESRSENYCGCATSVLVIALFIWAAVKDGQEDKALQRRLGIRRRTRIGR